MAAIKLQAGQAKYRVLGTNDDASSCCCCGREGLKRVVWLQPLDENGDESGVPVHFGTMCAAKASGWGYSSRTDAERRIAREQAEAVRVYREQCSAMMKALVADGYVVSSRVCYGFDYRSATYNYGFIYTLPGDPIIRIETPEVQRAEIDDAKRRLRERYPVFACLDRNLSVIEMRKVLGLA